MNIKTKLVNGKPVRHIDKDSKCWVVVCDLAVAVDFSPSTFHRHINKICSDDDKTIVGSSNACAVPVDIALASVNNILENGKWKRKRNNELTKNVITFLEQLQNPANKDICIRFVGTATKLEWIAADVVAALYPNDSEKDLYNRFKVVNKKWKAKKRINSNGHCLKVTTIFKPGVDELIEHSDSGRGEIVREWIDKQIEFETQLVEDPWPRATNHTKAKPEPEPLEDAITPVKYNFMGCELRFVSTEDYPEWVATDVVSMLYPNSDKQNYRHYLSEVDVKRKDKKIIVTNGGVQEVITINRAGVRQLITSSNSEIARYLQEKMFEGKALPFIYLNTEVRKAQKVVESYFMGCGLRFVGTTETPSWIVSDILQVLYPEDDSQDYYKYLSQIDSKWLSAVRINVDEEEQVFTTIYKPGLFELLTMSDSLLAQPLQERVNEQLDFVNSQNTDMSTEENSTDFEDEDVATEEYVEKIVNQEVITPRDFEYMGQVIRFVGTENKPEWVAADPVAILYPDADKRNYGNYLKKINPKWKEHKRIMTPGGPQTVTTLLEPGLWQLTARSDSLIAVPFQEWLCEKVLPSIRKTGSYAAPGKKLFNGNIDEFVAYAKEQIDNSLLPQLVKALQFSRVLREAYPHRKEFNALYQTLACQDLMDYNEDLDYRTFHSPNNLGVVYASKHDLDVPISGKTIRNSLEANNLIKKDKQGNWIPTDAGRLYCVMGWHKSDDGTVYSALQWRQETLLLLGTLHEELSVPANNVLS